MSAIPTPADSSTAKVCSRCGSALPTVDALACPNCGALAHAQELDRLSAEARWKEPFSPADAIKLWQECLALLPRASGQHAAIEGEIDRLRRTSPIAARAAEPGATPIAVSDTPLKGILKTGISMLVSIVIYSYLWDVPTAVGFVLLILVHEMGHVVANIAYDLPASAPLFIPFLGAVINLGKMPPNAKVEAIVGIAGPIAGTAAALVCFGWYIATRNPLALSLSWFGFTINLFNMLPVPPLDGGRVAAAISPWIWIVGLAVMGLMVFADIKAGQQVGIFLLILIFALPRIVKTLKPKGRSGPYYSIGRAAPLVIGAVYLLLLGLLVGLRMYAQARLGNGGIL